MATLKNSMLKNYEGERPCVSRTALRSLDSLFNLQAPEKNR
jgi:hypothetical protein